MCICVRNSRLQSAFVHVGTCVVCVRVVVCLCVCVLVQQGGLVWHSGSYLSCLSGPKPDDTHISGVCLHSVTQDCVFIVVCVTVLSVPTSCKKKACVNEGVKYRGRWSAVELVSHCSG